jgi:hypothetical protein
VNSRRTTRRRADSQAGQAFLIIVVLIAGFLVAALGLATDYTEVWARRQNAQNAADAACQAGGADVLLNAATPSVAGTGGLGSFGWIGTDFDCTSTSTAPPCRYAAFNGYATNVHVSFPSTVPGVPPLTGAFATTFPYIKVTVTDPVATYFSKVVSSAQTVNVAASATCGLTPLSTPIPLVILHPTAVGALTAAGSSKITVIGGPQRSIEVDSNNAAALSVGSTNVNIDLSQGGPSGSGSDIGVFGGPTTQPGGISLGSGHYLSPANPFTDPYATVNAPAQPNGHGTTTPVQFAMNGCPDPAGCVEFARGDYTTCSIAVTYSSTVNPPNGCLVIPITINYPDRNRNQNPYTVGQVILPTNNNPGNYVFKVTTGGTPANIRNNAFPTAPPWDQTLGHTVTDGTVVWTNIGALPSGSIKTAIFDPGLYYVGPNGLKLNSNSTVRMSTAAGDGNSGVTFYFSTAATVSVDSNSGKSLGCTVDFNTPNNCIVSYKIDGSNSSAATGSVPSRQLKCASGSNNPNAVPSTLDGNILLGPCGPTSASDPYGSPDGNRGFLFFQNRSASAQPSWGGGGQFLSSGFLYFHSGTGGTCGTNTTCLTLRGGSGSQSYTLGNIVTDELSLSGNPQINMLLNPAATFFVLSARLLQ